MITSLLKQCPVIAIDERGIPRLLTELSNKDLPFEKKVKSLQMLERFLTRLSQDSLVFLPDCVNTLFFIAYLCVTKLPSFDLRNIHELTPEKLKSYDESCNQPILNTLISTLSCFLKLSKIPSLYDVCFPEIAFSIDKSKAESHALPIKLTESSEDIPDEKEPKLSLEFEHQSRREGKQGQRRHFIPCIPISVEQRLSILSDIIINSPPSSRKLGIEFITQVCEHSLFTTFESRFLSLKMIDALDQSFGIKYFPSFCSTPSESSFTLAPTPLFYYSNPLYSSVLFLIENVSSFTSVRLLLMRTNLVNFILHCSSVSGLEQLIMSIFSNMSGVPGLNSHLIGRGVISCVMFCLCRKDEKILSKALITLQNLTASPEASLSSFIRTISVFHPTELFDSWPFVSQDVHLSYYYTRLMRSLCVDGEFRALYEEKASPEVKHCVHLSETSK
ncbi:hypothetical protein ADUPG1_013859 [Aduncisulcus paluster]|uniref:Uncharacterized protein n=1 Tax=Aduncisulcus paluster TaxID=2918883 RepID=A0ABQ5K6B0_9EUKA|nr:hypothetical protein ADUPG1_013859 [Aduncisulcus paluster]